MNKILVLCSFLLGCSAQPKFTHTVERIEIDQYMGTWYVQAGRFTPFEKEVFNSVERYTWNPDKEQIEIDFTYNKGSLDGKLVSMPQTGRIFNRETNSHWKVSPIWFLQFDFLIIAHAKDDSWTVIGVPDQSYLWIMTRERHPEEALVQSIIQEIKALHYNTEDIVTVLHSKN